MKNLLNTKLKDMKAITLIALVITIVVLIILAGVIISITLGSGGIIDRAKTAKQEYANAEGYEQGQIAEYSNKIDEYSAFTRAGGSNINYSTTEQDTGLKWIDGNKIYQKTINNLNLTPAWSGQYHAYVDTTILVNDADIIISAKALCNPNKAMWDVCIERGSTYWRIISYLTHSINALTLQYTKTPTT